MKTRCFFLLLSATIILTVLLTSCKTTLNGQKCFLLDESDLNAFDVSSWADHNHNVSRYKTKYGEPFVLDDMPKTLTIEFMGKKYSGDYYASNYFGDDIASDYHGDACYFEVIRSNEPIHITFKIQNHPILKSDPAPLIDDEILISKANEIFETYRSDLSYYYSAPTVVVVDYYEDADSFLREYRVEYRYRDERVKNQGGFYVNFTGQGELRSSSIGALSTAAKLVIDRNITFDLEKIKAEVLEQCEPVAKSFETRSDRELKEISIDEGTINFVYVDNVCHVGLYSKVTFHYIQEYPDEFIENGRLSPDCKFAEEMKSLEFVTILN